MQTRKKETKIGPRFVVPELIKDLFVAACMDRKHYEGLVQFLILRKAAE